MKTLAWMVRNRNLLAKKAAAKPEPRRRIVVVEHSAESIGQVLDDTEFQETIVVAESREDTGPHLAQRVAGRIAQLEQRHTPACSATLVLGQEHGGQARAGRELVARSLLSHLKASGGGELAISAPSPTDDECDEALDLLDRLLSELDTQSITIRLKFATRHRAEVPASGPLAAPSPLRAAS